MFYNKVWEIMIISPKYFKTQIATLYTVVLNVNSKNTFFTIQVSYLNTLLVYSNKVVVIITNIYIKYI